MSNQNVNINFTATANFSSVLGSVNQIKSALKGMTLPPDLTSKIKNSMTDLENSTKKVQNLLNKGIRTKADSTAFHKAVQEMDRDSERLQKDINKINNTHLKVNVEGSEKVKELRKNLEEARKKSEQFKTLTSADYLKGIEKNIRMDQNTVLKDKYLSFKEALKTGDSSKIIAEAEKVSAHLRKVGDSLNNTAGMKGRGNTLVAFFRDVAQSAGYSAKEINNLEKELKELTQAEVAAQKGNLRNLASDMRADYMNQARGLQQNTKEVERFNSQMGMLQSSADYFFGLQNMFYLMRRGLRETMDTVKNLDKAMTETAVVTDKTVGDLWGDLPEYTDLANKLGATTQGAYETMTLYYQQGLNKEQTFEIGEETMKMARIAGLDYAETTNMMTAALRGFNMELNQTSAKRVNDVYSKLAAITASDTKELGLAMERTASIAHSANMDFGTTTAFLAQMIETTREAPENLGTAMKTIIARFQELKENPMQIGEVEGEEVNYNRVDKALKTIGVQLVDSKDKFRDLDDVFLDISSKWDGLTQTQQRYIATTAAGSRQQSRFIAMMDNYKRTLQLVDAAANSEGASDVQFSKTLDSMESKLNQLHNAWDNFMMGVTNNSFLKWAVDMGTTFIGVIDKIISGISKATGPLEGLTRSALSLGALGIGLKAGGKLVNTGLGVVGNLIDPSRKTKMFGGWTGRREAGNAQFASQINTPIVNVLNNILGVVSKGSVKNNNSSRLGDYEKARKDLYSTLIGKDANGNRNQFGLNTIRDKTNNLSQDQITTLYKTNPVLQKATSRLFSKALTMPGVAKDTQRALNTYMGRVLKETSSGAVPLKQGFNAGTNRLTAAARLGGDYEAEIRKAVLNEARKPGAISPEMKDKIHKAATTKGLKIGSDERNAFVNNAYSKLYEYQRSQKAQANTTNLTGIEEGVLKIGNAASTAGQSVMGLGMALNSAGFTTAGSILTSVGSGIQGIGMAAQGAGVLVQNLGSGLKSVGGFLKAHPIALGATLAIGAITTAYALYQKRIKDIRKDGKKVETDYKKASEKAQKNINKLQDSKSDFERLSKGVDSKGYNIDLGDEEYKDYKKLVKDLVKINPSLVEGYNAQGEAIINKNKAIEESIKLQQEELDKAEEVYTSSESLDKLIAARNTKKRFDYGTDESAEAGARAGGATIGEYGGTQFDKDARSIVRSIEVLGEEGENVLDKLNEQYGVDFRNLTEDGVRVLQQHGAEILQRVKEQTEGVEGITDEQIDNVQDKIAELGKHTEGFDKVVEPVYKALSQYADKEGLLEGIPEEFRGTFDEAVKKIAGQKYGEKGQELSGSEMQKMVKDTATQIQDLKGHGEEYQKVLENVDKAQKAYSKDLDVGKYNAAIGEEIVKLQTWKKEFDKGNTAIDQATSELLNNQIEKIENFTKEGSTTLAEGFNTMTAEIESANKAYERYQKDVEGGDYYTGSDSLKQIYDDITSDKNWKGEGSLSFEKGAIELIGEDNFRKKTTAQIKSQVKQIGKYLTEDESGIANFVNDLRGELQNKKLDKDLFKGGKTIGDYIKKTEDGGVNFSKKMTHFNDAQLESFASTLGMSLDTFTALVNKARQFGSIDFSNTEKLKESLATSETSIIGIGKEGQKKIFTKESAFYEEGRAAGASKEEIENNEKELRKQGVVFMRRAEQMTGKEMSSYFKSWGINKETVGSFKNGKDKYATDTKDFIKYFDKAQYDKEEIKTMYESAIKKGLITDKSTADFEKEYGTYAAEKDPSVGPLISIQSDVAAIASKIDITNGVLTDNAKQQYKELANGGKAQKEISDTYDKGKNITSSEDYNTRKQALQQGIAQDRQAIQELSQMREKANDRGDKDTVSEIDALLEPLKDQMGKYDKWDKALEKKYGEINNKSYEKVKDKAKIESGNLTNEDKGIIKENGLDFNNIWKLKGGLAGQGLGNLIDLTQNKGVSNKGQASLFTEYINDHMKGLSSMGMTEFESMRKNMVEAENADKSGTLTSVLNSLKASIDKNTSKKDKGESSKDGKGGSKGESSEGSKPSGSKTSPEEKPSEGKPSIPTFSPGLGNLTAEQLVGQLKAAVMTTNDTGQQKAIASNFLKTYSSQIGNMSMAEYSKIRPSLVELVNGNNNLAKKVKGLDTSVKNNTKSTDNHSKKISEKKPEPKLTKDGKISGKGILEWGTRGEAKPGVKGQAIGKAKGSIWPSFWPFGGGLKKEKPKSEAGLRYGGAVGSGVKVEKSVGDVEKKIPKAKKITITAIDKTKNTLNSIKGKIKKLKPKIKVGINSKGLKNKIASLLPKKKSAPKLTITGDNSKAKEKVKEAIAAGKTVNEAKPKLKITSSFNSSGVDEAKALDGTTVATAYVDIKTRKKGKVKGNKDGDEEPNWTGRRNTLPVNPQLSFGSAANGLNNNKSSKTTKQTFTALTGEDGYEVAWIPSENRSTILGLNGPEFVDIPRDTVIYNHDQSKKIVKGNQNRPSFGSAANGRNKDEIDIDELLETAPIFTTKIGGKEKGFNGTVKVPGSGGSNKSSSKKSSGKSSGGSSGKGDGKGSGKGGGKSSKGKWKTVITVWDIVTGKISNWWENMARKIDAATRRFSKQVDAVSKVLESPVSSLSNVMTAIKNAAKAAANALILNSTAFNKAKSGLKTLDKGGPGDEIAEYKALSKKKKKTKANKNRLQKLRDSLKNRGYLRKKGKKWNITKKGNKAYKNRKNNSNWQQISYERKGVKYQAKGKKNRRAARKYKKLKTSKKGSSSYKNALKWLKKKKLVNKKGKLTKAGKKKIRAKKVSENKKEKINLSKYIKYENGAYVVDEKALGEVAKSKKAGGKKKADAIRQKANEKIDDLQSKLNDAEDKIKEIKDQFIDWGKQIYETFDTWKRELDNIAVTTQNISRLQTRTAIASSKLELTYNKMLGGFSGFSGTSKENIQKAIQAQVNNLNKKIGEAQTQRKAIREKSNYLYNSDGRISKEKQAAEANYNSAVKRRKQLEEQAKKNGTFADLGKSQAYLEALTKEGELKAIKEARQSDYLVANAVKNVAKREAVGDGSYRYVIDYNKLDKYGRDNNLNDEQLRAVEERIQELQNLENDYLSTIQDEIDSANEGIQIYNDMQQTLADLSQQVVTVLEDRAQRVIDRQSKINDTIKNETSKLLDGVRKSLDKRRQEEQNQKTEQEISDKQKRLAYLQSDTAGGHQVEIAQLQKEIEDSQKSYRETLEDQTINALQQQADEAAEQRERQIQILQSQLDYNKETNYFAGEVDKWMADTNRYLPEMQDALKENLTKDGETTEYQLQILNGQLEQQVTQLATFPETMESVKATVEALAQRAEQDSTPSVNVDSSNGNTTDTTRGTSTSGAETGRAVTQAQAQAIAKAKKESKKAKGESEKDKALKDYKALLYNRGNKKKTKDKNWGKIGKDALKVQIERGKVLGYDTKKVLLDLVNTDALTWDEVLKAYIGYRGSKAAAEKTIRNWWGKNPSKIRKEGFKKAFGKKYATGGIADYTGPAWLDGTKTKPELVLNAQDTKNFLALKDTLSGLQNKQFTSQSNGDLNFDIDINVEKIDNDYDVKKVADAVKREIVQSAKYRNVNIVRNLK